jgi:hypothetical protein
VDYDKAAPHSNTYDLAILCYQYWQCFFDSTVKEIKQSFLSVHNSVDIHYSFINLDLSLYSLPFLPLYLYRCLFINLICVNDAVKFVSTPRQQPQHFDSGLDTSTAPSNISTPASRLDGSPNTSTEASPLDSSLTP